MTQPNPIEKGKAEAQQWVRFSSLAFYLESAAEFLNKAEDLLEGDYSPLSMQVNEALEQTRNAIELLDKA